ncbi:DUF2950 domain-containing protein [Geomonas sp. RF6]|uniref:DUF2950 domain-containing protein n=1 Tax=Geomonas sp. RF6 TaxID=2897342 RepID=UPI001E3A374A|nr:DUF2950 domain-containing protein [Geomonas sp. RF6]UFS70251.1 DUF2950 domain-containing protein [Geomonas sp. RF6]
MVKTFREKRICFGLLLAILLALGCAAHALGASPSQKQRTFDSAEEAVKSLIDAVRSRDSGEVLAILGPGSREIVTSGDPVADKSGREEFLRLYDEKAVIEGAGTGKALLSIGKEGYPFPIPVVKKSRVWVFDAKAGKEELLNRRIGRNELKAVDVLHAYVDAQREYAAMDPNHNGGEFAQKIRSTPGKKDGLYWEAKDGEDESPLGPLLAQAAREGYRATNEKRIPYHGYLFRILTAQGKNADGGAFDYVVNGKMALGFALVAYPAQYGSSGVMTFIINQKGIVYQKDMGPDTGKVAAAIKLYNPDKSWKKVEPDTSVAGDATGR